MLGVLVVQQKQPRQFNEIEESFLVTLAAQLAVIIAHAQSQGQWRLEKGQDEIRGIAASSGVAIGEFRWDDTLVDLSEVYPASTLDIEHEQEVLLLTIEEALSDFRRMRKNLMVKLTKMHWLSLTCLHIAP